MAYPYLPVNPCCTDIVINDVCGCSSTIVNTSCATNDPCSTVLTASSTIVYNGPELNCISAEPCDTLNVVLQKIDEIICNLLSQINTLTTQVNNINTQISTINNDIIDINNILDVCCATTTTTTTSISPDWTFIDGVYLDFPTSTSGYILYEGGWTDYDDGQTTDPIPYTFTFYTDGVGDTEYKLSTNGFLFGIINNLSIYGNGNDLVLTPGDSLNDGDTQNFWYANSGTSTKWKTSVLVYCGLCCTPIEAETPYSYILNIYKDATTQYIETRVKTNGGGAAGPDNPSVGISGTTSQVWSSTDDGVTWTYLGYGVVQ